jgi:hypothetical protein
VQFCRQGFSSRRFTVNIYFQARLMMNGRRQPPAPVLNRSAQMFKLLLFACGMAWCVSFFEKVTEILVPMICPAATGLRLLHMRLSAERK